MLFRSMDKMDIVHGQGGCPFLGKGAVVHEQTHLFMDKPLLSMDNVHLVHEQNHPLSMVNPPLSMDNLVGLGGDDMQRGTTILATILNEVNSTKRPH